MRLFRPLLAAFSTYSAIPMPRFDWDAEVSKRVLLWFPAVGLVCGGALWGWYALGRALNVDGTLCAAVAVCLPLLLTGGIHMDGYMDTVDAISSHQPRERKLEIMKDSHCGAFAVIYCGLWLLLYFGLLHALWEGERLGVICPGFVLSRALSALLALTEPNARSGGMLHAVSSGARRAGTMAGLGLFALLAAGGMVLLAPKAGLCALAAALLAALAYRALTKRLFGGVTGDTAGFFLQLCELCIALGAWIGELL